METHGRGRDPTAEAPPTDPLPLADEALAGGPAPPAPPCCPCAALLPRLLAAHRMEVRRLLRGALSSLGRRLDSLERKTTRRRKEGGRGGSITCSSSSSPSPPDVTSSCSSSQSEQSRRRKRRRSHEGFAPPGEQQQVEQLRFVGQMAVGGGAEGAEPLVLRDVERRKRRRRGGVGQSEPAARRNGCSSQHALLPVVGRSWTFAAAAAAAAPPALRLSAVAVETVLGWAMGGACWGPRRPLRDGTAPPGADGDHSYSAAGPPRRGARWSLWLPRRRDPAPDPRSANGLSAADPGDQSGALMEFHSAKLSKRVSQIRIRRALPRETPLTPMGLPKAKRPKKKEFSLEEIYTNQNYEAPPSVRSLETIFEEPREKDGALLLIGQQKRRRLLLFPDFTQPRRRRRPQGAGLPVSPAPRKRGAVRRHAQGGVMEDGGDVDVMLVERLSELDDFLTRQGLDL